jgi:hypothetical protein
MRQTLIWVVLCVAIPALCITTSGVAEDLGKLVKRPLDLPSGGKANPEEEEDEPETIVFYGGEFEGDCFMWCFPVYGFCGDTTVWTAIRAEIESSVNQLSENSEFSLVAFNSQTYVWSYVMKDASAGNKAGANAWMATLVPAEVHCIVPAALTALNISQTSDREHKQYVLCGAREPYCNGSSGPAYVAAALLQITGANYENTPIHTVYFETTFYFGEQAFYQQLAGMNNGTFRQVSY